MPIANVELNTTFDEWRIRTNQLIVQGDQVLLSVSDLYPRTNTIMLNANTSYNVANFSAVQANTARLHANAAHQTANAGFDQANTARSHANVSFGQANTARTHANAAHLTANAAFDKANTAADGLAAISSSVSPAFIQANTARTHANAAFLQANTARTHANAAHLTANAAFNRANLGGVTIIEDSVATARYVTFTESTSGLVSTLNISSTQLVFNPSTGTLTATNFDSASDINKKTDITIIQDAMNKTNQLNGVQFTWKHTGQPSAGIIAQDLKKVMPELVSDDMSVSYNGIIGLLIEAIKELNRKIEKLENK